MPDHLLEIGGVAIYHLDTDISAIRKRLSKLPFFHGYNSEIDAALNIIGQCLAWLPTTTGAQLCNAALLHNDATYQNVSFYGYRHLADQFRYCTGLDGATDIQALAAFVLVTSIRAIESLGDCLTGDEKHVIPALESYQAYLDCIEECAPGAGAWLEPSECEACCKWGELATAASKQAGFKIDGILSGITRRKTTASRDLAIRKKALELVKAGTRFHNLNSKLRTWLLRETGESLSKVQMGALLEGFGLSLSTKSVNQRKK